MKKQTIIDFEDRLPQVSDLECGYLYKGTNRWIEDDQDLDAMYRAFNCGDKITIWCEGRLPTKSGHKRKACALLHVQCVGKEQSIPAVKLQVSESTSP